MVKLRYSIICLLAFIYIFPFCSCIAKEQSIEKLREYYSQHPSAFVHVRCNPQKLTHYLSRLNPQGFFYDYTMKKEKRISRHPTYDQQQRMGTLLKEVFVRLWTISENCRCTSQPLPAGFWEAVIYYGSIEVGRPNNSGRFHASCFYLPGYANGIYFSCLPLMNRVEAGEETSAVLVEAHRILKQISLQSWTHPWRADSTQKEFVSVDRFRNHVWWVGGNALGYRDLLATAVLHRSVQMVEVLARVCKQSFSAVAQSTIGDAFWIEGFTADGAGWGHGKQNLVWGYPIDGAVGALDFLQKLQGTPFEQILDQRNRAVVMNYLRGSSFYYYKGYIPPCVSRLSYKYYEKKKVYIPYKRLVALCVNHFLNQFSVAEQNELVRLHEEIERQQLMGMQQYSSQYTGIRWFWNNDDLVKKDESSYVLINMASSRCDGLESAHTVNDAANIYACDGQTLLMKEGNEYLEIMGSIDRTSLPGITARVGDSLVVPETNWDGYCSRSNCAAGVTDGDRYGACGFVFEKMDARQKYNKPHQPNAFYGGVKAYKSYFLFDNYLVALGAGIQDLYRKFPQEIHTTINQTWHKGKLMLLSRKKRRVLNENTGCIVSCKRSPVWIAQKGGFAYSLLSQDRDTMFYSVENRNNQWLERYVNNRSVKDLPVSSTVFQLWLNHGAHPVEDKYAYMVYLGDKTPELKYFPFQVIENTTYRQMVTNREQTICAGMVYNPRVSFQLWGKTCKVSVSCAFLLQKSKDGYLLTINDASMDASRETIQFEWGGHKWVIPCYQDESCGKPIMVRFSNKNL